MNAQLSATLGKASGKLNRWFSNIGQKTTGLLAHTTHLARHQVEIMSGKAGRRQTGADSRVNPEQTGRRQAEYKEAGYNNSNLTDDDLTDGDFEDDNCSDYEDDDVSDEYNTTIVDSAHVLTAQDLFLLRGGGETGEGLGETAEAGLGTLGLGLAGDSNSPRVLTGAYGRQIATRRYKDTTDTDSIVSDYSEIAEPLREHLANMHAANYEDDYACGNSDAGSDEQGPTGDKYGMVVRMPGECAKDFERRAKKANFLSLAAEFAALKSVDSGARHFDAMQREGSDGHSCSDLSVTSERSSNDRDSMSLHSATAPGAGSSSDECRDLEHSLSVDSGVVEPPTPYRDSSSTSIADTPVSVFSTASSHFSYSSNNGHGETGNGLHLPAASANGGMYTDANTRVSPGSTVGSNGQPNGSSDLGKLSSKRRDTNPDDPFDVYSIETALPQLDWDKLERAIVQSSPAKQPANTVPQKPVAPSGDREEIRRKLAMGSVDDDGDNDYGVGRMARRLQVGPTRIPSVGLHMCFMNEAADVPYNKVTSPAHPPAAVPASINNGVDQHSHVPQTDEDYFFCQDQLQQQARQALAQVKPMAQLQLALEKRSKKKSHIAEMVGLPDVTDKKALTSRHLHAMNTAQLQILLNELHSQIESLNEELVQQLIMRDDLHMEQDAMLVDIEDLHVRADEYGERFGVKKTGKVAGNK